MSLSDQSEQQRLGGLFDSLRERLLDLSNRNRMLNYPFATQARRHVQIVDEVLEAVHGRIAGDGVALDILALAEPKGIPADETTPEFLAALEFARVSDVAYLTRLAALASEARVDDANLNAADADLRQRVRAELGLNPRKKRAEVNRNEHAKALGIDPSTELLAVGAKRAHADKGLQTLHYPDELDGILARIGESARLAEQEMGLSTLFLAFGFLERYDVEASDKKLFAPLLLLPVRLEPRKVRGRKVMALVATAEAAEANLSLQTLLARDFGRTLPDFDAGDDDQPATIEGYFDRVRLALDGLDRWQIRRWLVLGHFAFGRFAMYEDLDPLKWADKAIDNRLVRAVLTGTDPSGPDAAPLTIPSDYWIDDPEIEQVAPFLIQDADASQHSALIDVMKGRDLVVQGPPGTGKSQTITNIIANALAGRKTVLFLAEKQAALDVVKRRLDRSGLGDFCLELHSDKSSPKQVIEALRRRTEIEREPLFAQTLSAPDAAWVESRAEISGYVQALHARGDDGETPFSLMWRSVRVRSRNADIAATFRDVELPEAMLADPARLAAMRRAVELYAAIAVTYTQLHGDPAQSPWIVAGLKPVPITEVGRLIGHLLDHRSTAAELAALLTSTADLGVTSPAELGALVAADRALGEPPATPFVISFIGQDLDELARVLDMKARLSVVVVEVKRAADLSEHRTDVLRRASMMVRGGASEALLDLSPAEARSRATRIVTEAGTTIDVIDAFQPLIDLLDLDVSLPAVAVEVLAAAVFLASRVTAEQRPWIGRNPQLDPDRFEAVRRRWASLMADDARLRQRMPASPPVWPAAAAISFAAATLRRSGFDWLFAKLFGAARRARATIQSLGFPVRPMADDLDRLASHVRALEAFEDDAEAAASVGLDWNGIATPFEAIATGLETRRSIRAKLGSYPHGAAVAERLVAAAPEQLAEIAAFLPAVGKLHALAADLRRRFDDRSLDAMRATLAADVFGARAILDADASGGLGRIGLPVREIARIAELRAVAETLAAGIERSPLAEFAAEQVGPPPAIAMAQKAVAWLQAVAAQSLPVAAHRGLTGKGAAEQRSRLRILAVPAARLVSRFEQTGQLIAAEFGLERLHRQPPADVAAAAGELLAHRGALQEILSLGEQRRALKAAGLGGFLDAADIAELAPGRLPQVFAGLATERRADLARRSDPALARQTGLGLDARRKLFAERDRAKIDADRKNVRARLLQLQPDAGSNFGPRASWTEMALLKNEFAKQRRFTPVRSLLKRAARSIRVLKPCLMMSPLSLAKFLEPGGLEFDLLVIDEASQMRPEDALGGLLRARQVVVVGDARQLPPTDFFNRSTDLDLDDAEVGEDLDDESILEACEKAFRQVRRLKWHYRSRCESLIAFSNREFYDNSLITFPSARPGSFSIDLIRVDGRYQARRNAGEARAIAEEAAAFMRRFADESEAALPTLGLVAVNTDQRDLIREELRRIEAGDEQIERYRLKAEARGEPVFVKNLENVQGDERDFIFISLTYGLEPGAKAMKQRFGPINSKQGHRRLNVLFSRARQRIGLFASFGSADVVPGEAANPGVHVLKRYLHYAETGGRAVVEGVGAVADSDFEAEVAERLRGRGFVVDLQVGVSGFRIDLGVRHPERLDRFLAGIECDGARYHASRSARDRDRLREEVLRGQGWNLLRVWSTDWFADPEGQTDRLVRQIEQLAAEPASAGAGPVVIGDLASLYPAQPRAAIVPEPEPEPELEPIAVPEPEPVALAEAASPSEAVVQLDSVTQPDPVVHREPLAQGAALASSEPVIGIPAEVAPALEPVSDSLFASATGPAMVAELEQAESTVSADASVSAPAAAVSAPAEPVALPSPPAAVEPATSVPMLAPSPAETPARTSSAAAPLGPEPLIVLVQPSVLPAPPQAAPALAAQPEAAPTPIPGAEAAPTWIEAATARTIQLMTQSTADDADDAAAADLPDATRSDALALGPADPAATADVTTELRAVLAAVHVPAPDVPLIADADDALLRGAPVAGSDRPAADPELVEAETTARLIATLPAQASVDTAPMPFASVRPESRPDPSATPAAVADLSPAANSAVAAEQVGGAQRTSTTVGGEPVAAAVAAGLEPHDAAPAGVPDAGPDDGLASSTPQSRPAAEATTALTAADGFAFAEAPEVAAAAEQPDAAKPSEAAEGVGAAASAAAPDPAEPAAPAFAPYGVTDLVALGFVPDPSLFYGRDYRPVIESMAARVIADEGPIYEDQLVTRIARAHGFKRNTGRIHATVRDAVVGRFPIVAEEGRSVIWPASGIQPVVPFRAGAEDVRGHGDVPIAELAGLAAPWLKAGLQVEEVSRRIAETLGARRPSETARRRFEAAIAAAAAAAR